MSNRPDWLKDPSRCDLALALLAAILAMVGYALAYPFRALGRLGMRWSQHKANR